MTTCRSCMFFRVFLSFQFFRSFVLERYRSCFRMHSASFLQVIIAASFQSSIPSDDCVYVYTLCCLNVAMQWHRSCREKRNKIQYPTLVSTQRLTSNWTISISVVPTPNRFGPNSDTEMIEAWIHLMWKHCAWSWKLIWIFLVPNVRYSVHLVCGSEMRLDISVAVISITSVQLVGKKTSRIAATNLNETFRRRLNAAICIVSPSSSLPTRLETKMITIFRAWKTFEELLSNFFHSTASIWTYLFYSTP